jgi:LmbE family N-acetylglucosaminyl deacetylase
LLIVSPHMDDAFLSCGGQLLLARALGHRCQVVDVFGVDSWTVDGCGTADQRIQRRRLEESVNASVTGADVEIWDYVAAWPGRGYDRWDAPLRPEDALRAELRDRIGALVAGSDAEVVLFPAAIGGHVDHALLHEIAGSLDDPRVAYFEDLPYAADESMWSRCPLDADARRAPDEIDITEVAEQKRRLVHTYRSQLLEETMRAITEHAIRSSSGPAAVERRWPV